MITFTRATDLNHLVNAFITRLNQSTKDPFTRHSVIVPSMSVRDWLLDRVAQRNGIASMIDAQFWGMFFHPLVERAQGERFVQEYAPLSNTAMQWRLFAELSAADHLFAEDSTTRKLLTQLSADAENDEQRADRLWQLAVHFAQVFTRYLTMRPDWLDQWQKGEVALSDLVSLDEPLLPWQQTHYELVARAQYELWMRCFAEAYATRQARHETFWQQLASDAEAVARLPKHVMVFGFERVSKELIETLVRLGQYITVDVFYHTPSLGYFGDMVDDHYLQKQLLYGAIDDSQHRSSIHPLFSRWGKQQRDLFRLLEPLQNGSQAHTCFIDLDDPPPQESLLGVLQQEIRNLTPGLLADIDQDDHSLRINGCHGLMRQLEALRGDIVEWLHEDDSRTLSDILVVLPDVEDAYGVISAVFPLNGRYDGYYLPAQITGVTPPDAARLWDAVVGWFDLIHGRFDAESVLGWLLNDEVCAMLDVSPEAMGRMTDALVEAGFRRGFNEAQLAQTLDEQDDDYRFSFCYALDRLVTGLLMPDAPLYQQTIVPQPSIMMPDRQAINALCRLVNHWQAQQQRSAEKAPLLDWLDDIEYCLHEQFAFAAHTSAMQTITQAIHDLRQHILALEDAQDGKEATVPDVALRFVLDDLAQQLSNERSRSEPSGVITIGSLTALRSLPYKLIALVDVDITRFPSNPPEDRYDLMAIDQARIGDHKPEQDDLAALLDIVLNAQETCWIYYNAYVERSQEKQMLAAPIAELAQYCQDVLGKQAETISIDHGADPFHADQRRAHPAPLWHSVCEMLQHKKDQPSRANTPSAFMPLKAAPNLSELSELTPQNITLRRIISDLQRPAAALARALNIYLSESLAPLPILEPLALDGLQRYQLMQQLIEHPEDKRLSYLPLLPAGISGQLTLEHERTALAQRRNKLLQATQGNDLTSCAEQTLKVAALNISAVLPEPINRAEWGLIIPGKAKDKHLLSVWLHHLLWHIAGGRGETFCAYDDQLIRFSAPEDAMALLTPWLQVWQYSQHDLWLLPIEVGYSYADPKKLGDNAKLKSTIKNWRKNDYLSDNLEAFVLLTRGHEPETIDRLIEATAERYTETLYAPIWVHSVVLD
ncbi:exodeoxyribonuclease V subunit gamma [Suttonella sp. R2A3]|uniref:exodeoxyribonuclease V subunit gamma n=1 Tax=Suttonella sp. R2A3 TaxID=2908648 RepID=UPI001F23A18F|nr:exodeoxyribonuclease V subunit gamma [Suttonella sp. R2A3]UJF25145.1 exodeoxyribonuclease V subunit gamma [Suttonella sp. R2A3]